MDPDYDPLDHIPREDWVWDEWEEEWTTQEVLDALPPLTEEQREYIAEQRRKRVRERLEERRARQQ